MSVLSSFCRPLAGALLFAGTGLSAQTLTSSVLDSTGGFSTSGNLTNLSAVAQPGGVQVSQSGTWVNYAGFLNSFAMKPDLDSDEDGVPDEWDADNDNDDLSDEAEISGSAHQFITSSDPNRADTDLDGMSDGDEALAETDPTDPNAHLRILFESDASTVLWPSRANRSYKVYRRTNLTQALPGVELATITAPPGGSAPWFVVTNQYLDIDQSLLKEAHYLIEKQP